MEAVNAVGLTPISVLSKHRKNTNFLIKSSLPTNYKNTHENIHKKISTGLVFLSSIINTGLAKALTYEEALKQFPTSNDTPDLDVSGFVAGITSLVGDNPVILFGGAAVLAVPLVVSQFLGKSKKAYGVESAKSAYVKLGEDGSAQVLDIRAIGESKLMGSPDLKGLKKKSVAIAYNGNDKSGFLKKVGLKFKDPENTTLFILDKFDGNSELVAELVTVNGFKAAYAIKDGAEGPRGWMKSNLPWLKPSKAFSFDLSSVTDAIDGAVEGSEALSLALGVAAATGLGLLAFTEIETILQVLGSAALIQFASKKLLFAEDRKQTLLQVNEFLDTKIAPKEFADEIKQIGKALLPLPTTSKALPAAAEASPAPAVSENTTQKAEAIPEVITEAKVEEPAAEPNPSPINSIPETEAKAESIPAAPRALSPFPYYPDFKPPTTPTPLSP